MRFCMKYRHLARVEQTLQHEFGYILGQLLKKGKTFLWITKDSGVSYYTLSIWAKRFGLSSIGNKTLATAKKQSEGGKQNKRYFFDEPSALMSYLDGQTFKEIAENIGIPRQVVNDRLRPVLLRNGWLELRCFNCREPLTVVKITKRFCSSRCLDDYNGYLKRVAKVGLGASRFGDTVKCEGSSCTTHWVKQRTRRNKYCSTKCRRHEAYKRAKKRELTHAKPTTV